jgi:hypothetical protein
MKKKYILPQTKIVSMTCQATILDGSDLNYPDAKENNFYNGDEDDEEDDDSTLFSKNIWKY